MMLQAYTVFDNKALTYAPPFFVHNDAVAMRSVREAANDANTSLGRHPGDFVLYHIGSYDDGKGSMQPISPLRHVMDVVALVNPAPSAPLFNAQAVENH